MACQIDRLLVNHLFSSFSFYVESRLEQMIALLIAPNESRKLDISSPEAVCRRLCESIANEVSSGTMSHRVGESNSRPQANSLLKHTEQTKPVVMTSL